MPSTEHFDDPVTAYSRLAPHYAELSHRRESYLRSIEEIIVSRIPPGSESLLDIGAGDGIRTLRIARDAGIHRLVLVEPSPEMSAPVKGSAEIWQIRAEDLNKKVSRCSPPRSVRREDPTAGEDIERFDVITCLWNVLGHIRKAEDRARAMRAMADRLAPDAKCFLDVTHRYNLRSYGVIPTVGRVIRDSISHRKAGADVIATWSVRNESISTHGHVFTDREIRQFARAAGLSMEERIVVDYDSGKIRQLGFLGNLLYVFRRSLRIESSSAAHTS